MEEEDTRRLQAFSAGDWSRVLTETSRILPLAGSMAWMVRITCATSTYRGPSTVSMWYMYSTTPVLGRLHCACTHLIH